MSKFYVYMLASKKRGVIYIGCTDDIQRRTMEHKTPLYEGFTKQYFIRKLVYFEIHDTAQKAITRERQMKKWNRQSKIELIEKHNPDWRDLSSNIMGLANNRIPAFAGM